MVIAHVVALVLVTSGAVGGTYDTPLGPITVKKSGGNVTGVAAAGGGPCAFKKGQSVLKGQLMDDSVSGKLSICSEGAGCGPQDAFVVLLVARDGELLSGAVQLKNKACKLPLEGKGIAFARTAANGKKSKALPKAARVKVKKEAAADPRNDPPPEQPADAPALNDTDVTAKFSSWNPETAERGAAPGGRKMAKGFMLEAEGKLINSGQWEAARRELLSAIKADPSYAEAYSGMGVTYYARDSYDDALDWYKKALTVNPDFKDAYYNIACIYSVEGKKPLALRYLRIAVLNGYSQPKVIEADGDLNNIRGEPEYKEIMTLAGGTAAPVATETPDAGPAPVVKDAPAPEPPTPEAPVQPPPPQ